MSVCVCVCMYMYMCNYVYIYIHVVANGVCKANEVCVHVTNCICACMAQCRTRAHGSMPRVLCLQRARLFLLLVPYCPRPPVLFLLPHTASMPPVRVRLSSSRHTTTTTTTTTLAHMSSLFSLARALSLCLSRSLSWHPCR